MEIELAVKILEMGVAVDEARQNREPARVDDVGVGRKLDLAPLTDRLEPARLDDNDGVLDGRTTGAVDQRSTLYHKDVTGHFSPDLSLLRSPLAGEMLGKAAANDGPRSA